MQGVERDLAAIAGEGYTVEIGGKPYRIKPLTPRRAGQLIAWLKDNVPHPVAEARKLLEGLPIAIVAEVMAAAYREARESWPPQFGTPAAMHYLTHGDGLVEFVGVAIRGHKPDATDAEIQAAADALTGPDYGKLMRALGGQNPNIPSADDNDPEDGPSPD